jgi:hypothetical protein
LVMIVRTSATAARPVLGQHSIGSMKHSAPIDVRIAMSPLPPPVP